MIALAELREIRAMLLERQASPPPRVVLDLLVEIERLRDEVDRLRQIATVLDEQAHPEAFLR